MSPRAPAAAMASTDDEPAAPVVPMDLQKAFWLNADLVPGYNALLERRRARDPKTRERALLNEAIALLLAQPERP